MNKRNFNIAYVEAELKAKLRIEQFQKEFENGDKNTNQRAATTVRQNNNAAGNVPKQPGYGG